MFSKVLSAAAIALVLSSSALYLVPTSAASQASITFIVPGEGGRIEPAANFSLRYDAPDAGGAHVAGRVMLDGVEMTTFLVAQTRNTTVIDGTFDASSFAMGHHVLRAEAWTENATSVTTQVDVDLEAYDEPPVVAFTNVSYDEQARVLLVRANISDADGPVTARLLVDGAPLSVLNPAATAFALPIDIPRGAHKAVIEATDGIKTTRESRMFSVRNALPTIHIGHVAHAEGGHILVDGTATDVDGHIYFVSVGTRYGSNLTVPDNTTGAWSADIVGDLEEGSIQIVATAVDDAGAKANDSTPFVVVGERRIVWEKDVTLSLGASTDDASVALPIVRNGTWHADFGASGAFVARIGQPGSVPSSEVILAPGMADHTVSVSRGSVLDARWAVAGTGTVRFVLEGTVL